jgi:hypothetical protein
VRSYASRISMIRLPSLISSLLGTCCRSNDTQ